jgi:hypothetical protein
MLGFSVKANADTSVLVQGLSFDHKRNCFGPFAGAVVYSLDGFETVADTFCFDINECWQQEWWNFCDFVLNPCETAEFRFILKDALNWCYGTFCLDNVRITGCPIDPPTSVPEPGSLALAAMAIAFGVGGRYRARRRKDDVAAL